MLVTQDGKALSIWISSQTFDGEHVCARMVEKSEYAKQAKAVKLIDDLLHSFNHGNYAAMKQRAVELAEML